jgi:type II secretion system protein N
MTLTDKHKRVLRWVGYPLLALLVFSFTLQLTFPYERVKDKLVEVLSEKYEVQIASVEPTFLPGGMVLESVLLKSRPTQPDEEPTLILVDRLRVDVGLLALLIGRASIDLVADMGDGSIEGNVTVSRSDLAVEFSTEDLPLESVPGLREALGLPMVGGLDAEIQLSLPEQRWDLAEGSFEVSCPGCVIGDGKTKMKAKPRPGRRTSFFASEGLTVPALNLGDLHGKITIAEGRGVVESFAAKSEDGDLAIHGSIDFEAQLAESKFTQACTKFRLSDALKQRDPSFGNVPNVMGAPIDADGYSNLTMVGKLGDFRWLAAKNCEPDGSAERLDGRGNGRPEVGAAGRSGRPRLPEGQDIAQPAQPAAGEAAPGIPGIPGTVPEGTAGAAGMNGDMQPAGADPSQPIPAGADGTGATGRRMSTDDVHPPPEQPIPAGDIRGDVENPAMEERNERAAEEARRDAERRAEEDERNEPADGENAQEGEGRGEQREGDRGEE